MWVWGGMFGQMTDPEALLLQGRGYNSSAGGLQLKLRASIGASAYEGWGKRSKEHRGALETAKERLGPGEEKEEGKSIWESSLSFSVLTSTSHQLLLVFHLQLVFCPFRLTWSHPNTTATRFLSAFFSPFLFCLNCLPLLYSSESLLSRLFHFVCCYY